MALTWKKIISSSAILLFLFLVPFSCPAHDFGGHNAELDSLLFGSRELSTKGAANFRLLCEALYITLDYTSDNAYRNSGERFLTDLKSHGVSAVPTLESITFASNQHHQRYTHRGWEFNYLPDKANWKARKQLLLSTVDKLGDFKQDEKIKLDAFAGLIYEIHILGDHLGDNEFTRNDRIRLVSEPDYRGQTVSPTSDGPFNNPTLYVYLLYHIQRLFREQSSSYEYRQLVNFLNRHKDEFSHFESSDNRVPYENVKFIAKKTKAELYRYLPALLSKERFFQEAFLQ